MATMKQIAQLAGVSRGTVDRVLNHRGVVNPETARRVREIAASLQYTPSRAALSLAARKRGLRLAYILFDPRANHFFRQVEEGVRRKARELSEYGVTTDLLYSDFSRPGHQDDRLAQAVARGASGVAIAGFNTASTAALLRQITRDGVPVVTANTDIPGSGRMAYVGSDYRKSSRTAAELLRMLTRGRARVGILIGSYGVLCHAERAAAFCEYLAASAPGMEVARVCENRDDDFESFSVTKALLRERPDIDALYLAAGGVYGACQAVKSLALKTPPLIVCHDCTDETRPLLEQGLISAAICQQPERQGAEPLELLFARLAMDQAPAQDRFITGTDILIRENL